MKSRFSHRQVMLYPNNNIAERLICIIDYLSLPEDSKLIVKPLDKHFSRLWNDKILQIFKSQKIILLVKRQLELDPSQRKLKTWLVRDYHYHSYFFFKFIPLRGFSGIPMNSLYTFLNR